MNAEDQQQQVNDRHYERKRRRGNESLEQSLDTGRCPWEGITYLSRTRTQQQHLPGFAALPKHAAGASSVHACGRRLCMCLERMLHTTEWASRAGRLEVPLLQAAGMMRGTSPSQSDWKLSLPRSKRVDYRASGAVVAMARDVEAM